MSFRKMFLVILILLPGIIGCQQEEDIIKPPTPAEAFDAHSTTADLIRRTTLRDGSSDNIIDSSSCSILVLPISVIVNGQQLVVQTDDDLKYVERLLDEVEGDEDEIDIVFPVTVILADHSEISIQNEDELEALRDDCEEGGFDDDIECIDFVYPIVLTVYNSSNEVADVVEIDSDIELYNFIEGMEEDDLVSFRFPLVVRLANGEEVTIHDNAQLKTQIESAADDCDEDDDTDFEDDDVDGGPLAVILENGSWTLERFFDDSDKTAQFAAYTFEFNADGTAVARTITSEVQGTWAIYGDNGELELDLDFGELAPFNELDEDWYVVSYTETAIQTKNNPDDEGSKELNFRKQ